MGANLASVHTSAEHQLIQRLTAHNGYGVTWVGGTDASGVFFLSLQYVCYDMSFLLSFEVVSISV